MAKSVYCVGLIKMNQKLLFESSSKFIEALLLSKLDVTYFENVYTLLAINFYNDDSNYDEKLKDQKEIIYNIFIIYKKKLV